MFEASIVTIPEKEHRYDTCGDWLVDDFGAIRIRVSEMGDWKAEATVAIHELIETAWCKAHGVTTGMVDAFDMDYPQDKNPGVDPAAPYFEGHKLAMQIEHLFASGIDYDYKTGPLKDDEAYEGMDQGGI